MTVAFDHRASIVKFLESQADKYHANFQFGEATALRATASSITAQLDAPNNDAAKITSPATPLIIHCVEVLGGTTVREVLSEGRGTEAARRARFAAIYGVKKRLQWSNECVGAEFGRDPSTISHAVARAEEMRSQDPKFKALTDELIAKEFHCPNCLAVLAQ